MSQETAEERNERMNRDKRVSTARTNARERSEALPEHGYAKPKGGDKESETKQGPKEKSDKK